MADSAAPAVRRAWLAAGWLMLAVVLWGTLTPEPPQLEPPIPQFDKLEHFGAFLLLSGWFTAALPGPRWTWGLAAVFIALGGAIELIQGWTGFRDAEWMDWVSDSVGVVFGVWLAARGLSRFLNHLSRRYERSH